MCIRCGQATFSHLADAFTQSDLQLGVHKAINLEEANIQRKCSQVELKEMSFQLLLEN